MKQLFLILSLSFGFIGISSAGEIDPNDILMLKSYGSCESCNLQGIDLRGVTIRQADLGGADLSGADLSGAILKQSYLKGINLSGANLSKANLFGANLTGANLTGANLTGAYLKYALLTGADLSDADLSKADLIDADLSKADFTGANLTGANLTDSDLIKADLFGANLTGANLTGTNLKGVDLTEVDFTGATVSNKVLEEKIKRDEEKRVAEEKKAEDKKIAEEKRIAEEKKIAEEKTIAEEILIKKIALIPPKTELQKAQNFLSDIQVFVASNPDEFDIFEIAMFTMNTKLISEGVSNDEQMNTIELFKEFVKTSNVFLEFEEKRQDARNQIELKKIDRVIKDFDRTIKDLQSFDKVNLTLNSVSLIDEKIESSQLILDNFKTLSELENTTKELTIFLSDLAAEHKKNTDAKKSEKKLLNELNAELSRIDQHINKLKTYFAENLSSISPELMPLILEKVTVLKTIKNESSFKNKSEELKALRKVNEEISNFILDNNITTKAELAEEKNKAEAEEKRKADAKKAEEKSKADAKKAEEKSKADAKEAKRLKNFKTVKLTCIYARLYNFGSLFLDEAEQKWKYDGKNIYLNGTLLKEGIKMRGTGGNRIILKKLTKQDVFKTSVYVGMNGETLMFTQEIDFDNKESFMNFEGRVDDGTCFPW